MAFRLTMPQMGETVTEGAVEQWLKQPGERVEKYEPLVEINTDKVNVEMPSPVAGVLKEIVAPEGTVVQVGALLALIEEEEAPGAAAAPAAVPAWEKGAGPAQPRTAGQAGVGQRATPRVRRLAAERGVYLAAVTGAGPGGRITEDDVLAAAAGEAGGAEAVAVQQEEEKLPLSGVRRTIAQRMAQSKSAIPHAWLAVECDVTGLVGLREGARESFRQREGIDLTYLPFMIRSVAEAIKEHPLLNSSWGEDGIVLKKRIHIGLAAATEQGLIVPVIHDAGSLSFAETARAAHDLTERARAGRLRLEDVQGATFTVNNTGVFGSVLSAPIISPGQAAIITMESIGKRPVVLPGDAIAVRSMVNVCLSFDHRILDGAQAGGFLQSVKSRLEAIGPAMPLF